MSPDFQGRILQTKMFHRRNSPRVHEFSYSLFYLKLRLGELPLVSQALRLLAYNRFSLFSIWDRDYLSNYYGTLTEKVSALCKDVGISAEFDHIDLITHPRCFGYVFNPVSFFICVRHNNPEVLIAEVHNTFGEKHLYACVAQGSEERSGTKTTRYAIKKEFHVSPFFDRSGHYDFILTEKQSSTSVRINLLHGEDTVFESGVVGKEIPLTKRNLFLTAIRYPGSIFLTMSRIIYHAAILKFLKRMKVYTKPIATSDMTIEKNHASILQKFCRSLFYKYVSQAQFGSLSIAYPDSSRHSFGNETGALSAHIQVYNDDLFLRSIFSGDIGFGESYVEGDWDTKDLTSVLRFFARNLEVADDRKVFFSYFGRIANAIHHVLRPNSVRNSRHNISQHYDLSNELFSRFLDSRMQYSSGVFSSGVESLEDAQLRKISSIISKADIQQTDHVLEIGCGWGGLAIELVKKTGCRYTGVTLSEKQKQYFEEKVREAGLEDHITILLKDYRLLEGTFDKIISVEMVEAVGHAYLPEYFKKVDSLLSKEGLFVIQAITIPERRYNAYRRGCDWIQKYIFPGGLCPSISALIHASRKHSHLTLESTENIGLSYAKTLEIWRMQFNLAWDDIKKLGFDERFKRIWNYYLAYCEAGFREHMVNVHQMVYSRQGNSKYIAKSFIE